MYCPICGKYFAFIHSVCGHIETEHHSEDAANGLRHWLYEYESVFEEYRRSGKWESTSVS